MTATLGRLGTGLTGRMSDITRNSSSSSSLSLTHSHGHTNAAVRSCSVTRTTRSSSSVRYFSHILTASASASAADAVAVTSDLRRLRRSDHESLLPNFPLSCSLSFDFFLVSSSSSGIRSALHLSERTAVRDDFECWGWCVRLRPTVHRSFSSAVAAAVDRTGRAAAARRERSSAAPSPPRPNSEVQRSLQS